MIAHFSANERTQAMSEALFEQGAIIVEQVVDQSLISTIKAELQSPFEAEGHRFQNDFNGHHTRRLGGLLEHSEHSAALLAHPLVLNLAEEVLGPHCETFQVGSTTAIEILPGEAAQVLHRDDECYPIPEKQIEFQISALWALDDFTKQNGATRVLPREAEVTEPSSIEQAVMGAGSALLYLGSTFHGGGANLSPSPRRAIVNTYALGWLRQEENQYLTLSKEVVEAQPEHIQRLLGFQAHGKNLGVWPDDPDGYWFDS